ncbi:MAG: CAP domain-containing protein [Candidatus Paceibacterota bacterium]
MRFFFQIIIIGFVIYSIFLMKEDIRHAYTQIAGYVETKAGSSLSRVRDIFVETNTVGVAEDSGDSEEDISIIREKTATTDTHVDAPGALRVLNSFLGTNTTTSLSADAIVNLSNVARKQNGNLKPLIKNSKLDFAAEKKLQDMFMRQYFEHTSPVGVEVSDLGKEVGYDFIIIGENLALGNFKDDQALVDAWMASPGHRANILNTHYSEIGVAVGKNTFEGRTVWMAVQHFGLPKSACPQADHVLLSFISLQKKKIASMESDLSARRSLIDSGAVYQGQTEGEQIKAYNELVDIYNALILETKRKVAEYNKEVRIFNDCVASHTSA